MSPLGWQGRLHPHRDTPPGYTRGLGIPAGVARHKQATLPCSSSADFGRFSIQG